MDGCQKTWHKKLIKPVLHRNSGPTDVNPQAQLLKSEIKNPNLANLIQFHVIGMKETKYHRPFSKLTK